MAYNLKDKYVSLLTDFGFQRVFGTEPNKAILIDFLNTLLPEYHCIQDLTFKNTDKVIFDIYCQAENGDRFIVEIQKAKQNFFKERSVYYSTFPIQEQALKGEEWNFNLSAVYTVGVLDFIFDDHKDDDTIVHIVQLKNQNCEVFYDKLKFIYIQLPKFKKTIDQLETHLDKWLFILKNLANLSDPLPESLQETAFNELFEVAEIANFSLTEQASYHNSLKYYRDMNNVVDTARQEGREKGIEEGIEQGRREERSKMLLRLLPRSVGELSDDLQSQINQLSIAKLDELTEFFLDFTDLQDLINWLQNNQD